jgi:hypothetical protein
MESAGFLMIKGFGYSPDEMDSFGALWGDLRVSREDIAFQGASYLRDVLSSTSRHSLVRQGDEARKF